LYSKEFWNTQYIGKKFKPPLRYAISAVRISGVPVSDVGVLHDKIQQMGEPLYRCLTPDGYAATSDLWLNSDALMRRIDFARFVIHNPFMRKDDRIGQSIKAPDVSVNSMAQTMGYLL